MLISTRGRYALRVMTDLAEHGGGDYTVLMDVAGRQDISEKYLEGIFAGLSRAGLVQAARGRGGGYRLARRPEEYTAGEILRAAGEELAPVACLGGGGRGCARCAECRTLPVWEKLDGLISGYLDSVKLSDLCSSGTLLN